MNSSHTKDCIYANRLGDGFDCICDESPQARIAAAASAARDFLRDRFGHAEAQHDPEALHALAELDRALAAK